MKGAQLALPVQLQQIASFDNFFLGPNGSTVSSLRHLMGPTLDPGEKPRSTSIWLYGGAHSGKSHLLQALVSAHPEVQALGLKTKQIHPAALPWEKMESCALLAIDDVEPLLEDRDLGLRLMRLLDQRRLQRQSTLVTAGASPSRVDVAMPDLRTRLSAMVLLGLKPLQDLDRRELILRQAKDRGLELREDVVTWMLSRLQRDAGTLIAAIDRVDQGALRAKRRPSLPLVQKILESEAP